MSDEQIPIDGRFTCPQCSRFIAQAAIEEWNELDASAYYGVTTRYVVNCKHCGRLTDSDVLFPQWVPTRWGTVA